ncbi:MAG: DMT family transporter [Firmicutes bacterium]|nr:DMT family transporter [Bacillota bacterium]MCM1401597.1 DMT family transporter [Bacteroides sp.]MCM1477241.1 DMT family transporter [Bacteroides sp.]
MISDRKHTFTTGKPSSTLVYHLGAFVAATAWGIAFINTKVLLQCGLGAVEIYIYRFLLAYLFVLLITPKPFFSRSLADELKFMLCGICGNSIYFIAENTAVKYTLVTNVSLIVTLSPIITALLIGLVYKSQRPSKGFMTGSIVAFFGVACVIFNSSFVMKVNPIGDLLALLSALCWSIYSILLKPLNAEYNIWFITRKTFFYGLITSLPFLAVEPNLLPLSALLNPVIIGNLCFLGLFASLIAYVLWAQSIKRLGVISAGNYLYLSPIMTLVASYLYLGEHISAVGYTGCALILIGVILSEKLNTRKQ